MLIIPVADLLEELELIVVPDRCLNQVPFLRYALLTALQEKKIIFSGCRTLHKLNCELSWWYLAAVIVRVGRLEPKESLGSLERS